MANESIHMPSDQNLDYQMVAQIVDGLKKEQKTLAPFNARLKMHTELRMLTFWRYFNRAGTFTQQSRKILFLQSDHLRVHGIVSVRVYRVWSGCRCRCRGLRLIRHPHYIPRLGTLHRRSYALLHPHLR